MVKRLESKYIDSREVAEMVGKEHSKLMRDIRNYTDQFNQSNIGFVDFFAASSYTDGKGEERPCYRITKKGCEFIAHKLTGIKGTEFTAKYIDRFHEMEDTISHGFDLSQLSPELQAIFAHDKKIQLVMGHMETHERRIDHLENTMTIDYGQQKAINDKHHCVGIEAMGGKRSAAYKNRKLRDRVFRTIWRDYKDYFEIASYKDTPTTQFDEAIEYLGTWAPDTTLKMEIWKNNREVA